jgi:hypothetical protein
LFEREDVCEFTLQTASGERCVIVFDYACIFMLVVVITFELTNSN